MTSAPTAPTATRGTVVPPHVGGAETEADKPDAEVIPFKRDTSFEHALDETVGKPEASTTAMATLACTAPDARKASLSAWSTGSCSA